MAALGAPRPETLETQAGARCFELVARGFEVIALRHVDGSWMDAEVR
jgi:hypothetical protein